MILMLFQTQVKVDQLAPIGIPPCIFARDIKNNGAITCIPVQPTTNVINGLVIPLDPATNSYKLLSTPVLGSLRVYRNGVRQAPGNDYTFSTTSSSIVFTSAQMPNGPVATDIVLVDYTVNQ